MKPCGCRVDTKLDDLCDDCFNKAWDNAEMARKNMREPSCQPSDGWLYGVGNPPSTYMRRQDD